MKKIIVCGFAYLLVVMFAVACTNSLDSRVNKSGKKYQEMTMAQKEKCGLYSGIAANIFAMKQMGRNLAEVKANIQEDNDLSPDIKLSAVKIADLLYSNNISYNDSIVLGQVVCTEDMK
jgi:hypothetical protein